LSAYEDRIAKMRRGEKIKCPKCENGFFEAKGDPKKTLVFGCDKCDAGMVLTVPMKVDNE